MGSFDMIYAGKVRQLQAIRPTIKYILVIPYRTKKLETEQLYFDEILYPAYRSSHHKARILERNHYMIEAAEHGICYVPHPFSRAAASLLHTQMCRLNLIDLAENTPSLP